jgi:hypothetical protein
MEFDHDKNTVIKLDILRTLKFRIYLMERENHKTKKFKENEMVDRIRKLIETEVNKSDN